MLITIIKPAYARICNRLLDPNCTKNTDPVDATNSLIQVVFGLLLIVGTIFCVYHLILAGFKYIQSEGDSKKLEEVKSDIINVIVGLAIMFSVFAIIKLIGTLFGIPDLQNLELNLPSL